MIPSKEEAIVAAHQFMQAYGLYNVDHFDDEWYSVTEDLDLNLDTDETGKTTGILYPVFGGRTRTDLYLYVYSSTGEVNQSKWIK